MAKSKLLVGLLILSLLLCGLPSKSCSAAEYKYAIEGEDYVLNVSPKFNAPHHVNGYCFDDMSYYWRGGQTYMICTVTNISDVARDVILPEIYLYDDTGMNIGKIGGILTDLKPGESAQFNASTTQRGIVDAYDYTIIFSPGDYLDSDGEIIIKRGVICTSHEIKENDTVTLLCEESDEGVVYQWFWSENRSGGGTMIQGANDRRLVLSNVSLWQYGQYYYCQINKNGVIENTDRFELIIKPLETPKPTASPTPEPTASPTPSPAVADSPVPDATAEPTVKPTEASTAPPSAEPTAKASPSPPSVPDIIVIPDTPSVPVSSASPEPTASPDITPSPEPSSVPSPTVSPSVMPDIAASPSPVPETSPSPEPSQTASPSQYQTAITVRKLKVRQTVDLKAKLTWEKTTVDNIIILRAEKKNGSYRIINQISGNRTSYTDNKVKRGKTYYYKVAAYNGDLQAQIRLTGLKAKRIRISYLISPVVTITKGNSGGQKYVQIFLRKCEGQYADIYMKTKRHYKKLAVKKRTIQSYRKRYRFRYRRGGVTLYFRVRTYRRVKGKKQVSPYSKTVKIKI
ncbi:MAG: hypothetical protein HFH72_14055 [Lachnospiraceae bacterium]|nr:hypothetical protein [Lachnospiraceae bacterium]